MLLRTQEVLAQMKAEGKDLKLGKIAAEVGISLHELKSYPSVRDLLMQIRHEYRCQFQSDPAVHWAMDDPLLSRAQQAVKDLRSQGIVVTMKSVARQVPAGVSTIRCHPVVWHYVREERQLDEQQRDQQLIVDVQKAVDYLKQRRQTVSANAVSRIIGRSNSVLKRRPWLQAYLGPNRE